VKRIPVMHCAASGVSNSSSSARRTRLSIAEFLPPPPVAASAAVVPTTPAGPAIPSSYAPRIGACKDTGQSLSAFPKDT